MEPTSKLYKYIYNIYIYIYIYILVEKVDRITSLASFQVETSHTFTNKISEV